MRCPKCGVTLNVPETLRGKLVSCSACKHAFVATETEDAGPAAVTLSSPLEGGPARPAAPPLVPPPAPPYATPHQTPTPGYPSYPPPGYAQKPQAASGHAIAAMVLGIVSIPTCTFYGIPSLVCGILGVVFARTAERNIAAGLGSPSSLGMAKAGRICGWIGIALSIAMWGFLIVFLIIGLSMPGMMR